jgi:hypothetical protein
MEMNQAFTAKTPDSFLSRVSAQPMPGRRQDMQRKMKLNFFSGPAFLAKDRRAARRLGGENSFGFSSGRCT